MAKKFTFRGHELDELKKMSLKEFSKLVKSTERRKLQRLTTDEKKLLEKFEEGKQPIRTHCRSMVIIPLMIGKEVFIHNGRNFNQITITPEMLGHRLGEFADTRKRIKHGAPGMGATRSSMYIPLK